MTRNQSTEDYIKGIYKLQQRSKGVSTSELARHLKIGDGSVTAMLKRLSTKNLIHYTPYKGVSLTSAGQRLALQMVRRHRLWERFLVEYLGYRWDEIHDEAERLEHVTSEEMEHRLDRALGYPRVDPHGDPIPTTDGDIDRPNYRALSDCSAGDIVTIVRVADNHDILQHASALGLTLSKKILVKAKLEVDGSVVVKVGLRRQFLSKVVANSIFVEASA